MVYQSINHADDTFESFWKQKESEKKYECEGKIIIIYQKTFKEASTVLCSVVKHLGSGNSTQEVGRNSGLRLVFLYTSFVLSPLPVCFKTEQSTVDKRLRIKIILNNF